jgi:hypothetical protein
MYPTTQQYSSTSTNQTNILCLDSLCPGNFGKRTSGALQIELEGQRVGKTYKSHFPIVLRIQFHTRRRTLNPLRALQPSQIDLPASSIIDSSALNNPTTPPNSHAHSTLITLPIVSISDSIQPCLPPKRKADPPPPLDLVLNTTSQLQRASPPATIATRRTPNQRFLKTSTCQKICGTPCDNTFLRIHPRSPGNHWD